VNLFVALRTHALTAPSALDVLCSKETVAEIIAAMTPQQLVVAALLAEGMTLKEIGIKLDITWQAVQDRNRKARERVAGAMYHANAEHLVGDVMSRNRWKKKEAA